MLRCTRTSPTAGSAARITIARSPSVKRLRSAAAAEELEFPSIIKAVVWERPARDAVVAHAPVRGLDASARSLTDRSGRRDRRVVRLAVRAARRGSYGRCRLLSPGPCGSVHRFAALGARRIVVRARDLDGERRRRRRRAAPRRSPKRSMPFVKSVATAALGAFALLAPRAHNPVAARAPSIRRRSYARASSRPKASHTSANSKRFASVRATPSRRS